MKFEKYITNILNILSIAFLVTVLNTPVLSAAETGEPLTANQIADRCIEAMGSEKSLRTFADYKIIGNVEWFYKDRKGAAKTTITRKSMKYRRDNMSKRFGPFTYGFDGGTAWYQFNGSVSIIPSINYKSDLKFSPLLLLEKNISPVLLKETMTAAAPAYGLRFSTENGDVVLYIDKTAFTVNEIRYKALYNNIVTGEKERIVFGFKFYDYKINNGIMFPHRIVEIKDGVKKTIVYVKTVEFNPKTRDGFFAKPAKELDLRSREEKFH